MAAFEQSTNNYVQLAQLYSTLNNEFKYSGNNRLSVVKHMLENGFDVNYTPPVDSNIRKSNPKYMGYSALHFAADFQNLDVIKMLLENGADITSRNHKGLTTIQTAFESKLSSGSVGEINPSVHELLLAYTKMGLTENVVNKNGLSYFHMVCTVGNIELVNYFLEAGVPINHAVNLDSPQFPGYTALHFAILYNRKDTVRFLLDKGADAHYVSGKRMTPLCLVIERSEKIRNEIQKKLCSEFNKSTSDVKNQLKSLQENECMMELLLSATLGEDLNPMDDVGLTHFHATCTREDPSLTEKFLESNININAHVNCDSPKWPGYTPLHFAVVSCLPKTINLLLENGADLFAKDVNSVTPFELAMERFELNYVRQILEKQTQSLKFIDGTNLMDFLEAFESPERFDSFMKNTRIDVNTRMPLGSPVYPAYTPLHVAVVLMKGHFNFLHSNSICHNESDHWICKAQNSKRIQDLELIIKKLLSFRADCTVRDTRGMTPLHHAFELDEPGAVYAMVKVYPNTPINPVTQDNLSHLHIGCATKNEKLIETLLRGKANPALPLRRNFKWHPYHISGMTPLHLAVASRCSTNTITSLLRAGADPNAQDANGETPTHLLMKERHAEFADIIEKFKENGADFRVKCNKGLSPLHIPLLPHHFDDAKIRWFMSELDVSSRWQVEDEITQLHMACALKDEVMLKKLLERDYGDVNSRVSMYSPLWPGDTPLHVLVKNKLLTVVHSKRTTQMIKQLVTHGADVTLHNADSYTPLHLAYFRRSSSDFYSSPNSFTYKNPKDSNNLSHFHLCCRETNKQIIDDFLKAGVDINEAVDHFAENRFAGWTPLHFAVSDSNIEVIEYLIARGADVTIRNSAGLTPFHLAIYIFSEPKIETILRSCFDIVVNATSKFGWMGIEMLIGRNFCIQNILRKFLQNGFKYSFAKITSGPPLRRSFIKSAFLYLPNQTFELLVKLIADLNVADSEGRNAIHHVLPFAEHDFKTINMYSVLVKLEINIETLVNYGCDINHQDREGRTPLHRAIITNAPYGAMLLIRKGADINVKDYDGKTPCSYLKPSSELSFIGTAARILQNEHFQLLVNCFSNMESYEDSEGCNALHRVAPDFIPRSFEFNLQNEFVKLDNNVETLLNHGYDLNHQDHEGKTPLHRAVISGVPYIVEVLLHNGADINVKDNNGKTPCGYVEPKQYISLPKALKIQLKKLMIAGAHVDDLNKEFLDNYRYQSGVDHSGLQFDEYYNLSILDLPDSSGMIKTMKEIKITESFTVGDFFAEKDVRMYPRMSFRQRNAIQEFLNSEDKRNGLKINEVNFLTVYKAQYRRFLPRMKLMEPAINSLQRLFLLPECGFPLPVLCCKDICNYLENNDLRNLIETTNLE